MRFIFHIKNFIQYVADQCQDQIYTQSLYKFYKCIKPFTLDIRLLYMTIHIHILYMTITETSANKFEQRLIMKPVKYLKWSFLPK